MASIATHDTENNSTNPYDSVPYESYPYVRATPESILAVGRFFGLEVPHVKKARVLELGCASGGHIIPFALRFPNSECVAVDYSQKQIDLAQKQAGQLGLTNITFHCESFADLDDSLGQFDVIIAHGIYSWIDDDMRETLLQLCHDRINDNGLIYISYNTLPGWNQIKSLRDMMLYHTSSFTNPNEKILQSRVFLKFLQDSISDNDATFKQLVKEESDRLASQDDSYLVHDHLEENNKAFYFHEFVKQINNKKLQYVADSVIATMYQGNFPKEVVSVLSQIKNDVVTSEQYMDFIRNRRFRASIITKGGKKFNRHVDNNSIKGLSVASQLVPKDQATRADVLNGKEIRFVNNKGVDIRTNDILANLILFSLYEANSFLPVERLIDDSLKEIEVLGRKISAKDKVKFKRQTLEFILTLVLNGTLDIQDNIDKSFVSEVSEKPKVCPLVLLQAPKQSWVTSRKHEKISVDNFTRTLITLLNGERDVAHITKTMVGCAEEGVFSVDVSGRKVTEPKELEECVAAVVNKSLSDFARTGLLIG